jgi:hypothetical protein
MTNLLVYRFYHLQIRRGKLMSLIFLINRLVKLHINTEKDCYLTTFNQRYKILLAYFNYLHLSLINCFTINYIC